MSKEFLACVAKKGSRVRTIKPNPSEYLHVCYDSSGKSYSGEVKKTKTGQKREAIKQAIKKVSK